MKKVFKKINTCRICNGKNLINVSGTTSFNIDEVYVPTWEVIDAVFLK